MTAAWPQPMLATLTERRFSDPDWIFERKLDGERALGGRVGGRAALRSRTGRDLADAYPELVHALGRQPADDFVVDGEIVGYQGREPSFAALQRRMQLRSAERARASGVRVVYYVFDLLRLEGDDLTGVELRQRKARLRRTVRFAAPLRFTPHRNEAGELAYRDACRRGWEGVIAKRASGTYRAGRSTDWLKFKCVNEQEFVIGGFTDPGGSRAGFGALIIGYYESGRLRYAGKVGTGYDEETLRSLGERLRGLEQRDPPFDARPAVAHAHWVRPELVAQIAFTEITREGRLRHPRFRGLRRDKPAEEVVLERGIA
ncbi:MAG TPA: non-homologous end-joining DNA ligase [Gaiellales bacterium]|jgi:bifunctional non-homologous end joining protein LigD|nr:non-homologous end-joining DNA ligase [Gaiellales bacterium]